MLVPFLTKKESLETFKKNLFAEKALISTFRDLLRLGRLKPLDCISTFKYIKKNYPNLKIGILDQKLDKNYLEQQQDYDLAIKTPGILLEKF